MDLGIRGKKSIVCASSQGLGRGCAMALALEGVDLVINGRTIATVEATAAMIRRETGVSVTPVAADITTPEGRKAVLAACPDPDILVNNAGGPPIGDFRERGGVDERGQRQHDYADHAGPVGGRRNDCAPLWTHREYYLAFGEGSVGSSGSLQRRSGRSHRLCCRPCATSRQAQRRDQQPLARPLRNRSPNQRADQACRKSRARVRALPKRECRRFPLGVSAPRRNSAKLALFSAAPMLVFLSGKTF
jgi:short subunit dehydrogenase